MPGVKNIAWLSALNGNLHRFEVETEIGRDVRRELAYAVVQSGWGLIEIRAKDLNLEEAFLKLTQETQA